MVAAKPHENRWVEAWPDALAFSAGLSLAWYEKWQTADLVWSLWLSSLVVGYAMILWNLFGPAILLGREVWKDQTIAFNGKEIAVGALGAAAYVLGALFLLVFFTFHFGLFHFVHSAFLAVFFPLEPGSAPRTMPGLAFYAEVLRRYWIFLPMTFLAERQAFRLKLNDPEPPDTSVKAADIEARKARNKKRGGLDGMMTPYKNVIRMHLLIFFFAFAHFAKLENFLVYAVVSAAYFFPWRLLRKKPT